MKNACESCGMPLSKDPIGGGTEKDGTLSIKYCSYCYKDGAFLSDSKNAQEFQKMVYDIMVSNGHWKPIAWLLTRGIPSLPRWKNISK